MSSFLAIGSRCGATLGRNLGSVRTLHLNSSVRSSYAKTPIQEYGSNYLKLQEKSKRPLSPHLSIYQPQLTWVLSGFHRITGCVMGGVLLVGGIGFAVLPVDFTTFVETIRGWNLPFLVTDAFKFIIAFPIFFHALNGFRFLGYDMAKGVDLPTIYRTGWLVVGLSAILSVL
uniref:Succinate dehydrogenase cytochrome b560 subunit, mitochondrial n=1 Tax=Ditylenchus dipsaci TaxID=166011 RepID=A0A915D9I9_9BILA